MLLASFSTLVSTDYKIIDIHDSDREIEYTPSLRLPGRTVLGVDTGHIYINCAEDLARILVSMHVWDSAPGKNVYQGWSEPEEAELSCASGTIHVDQWTRGLADVWHLPVSGDLHVSVRSQGRDTVRQRVREVRRQGGSVREVDGTEGYLIDAWPL
ncbi:hypothetical protein [Nocardiopsis alborubida]|uniref:Uncharacterized protein n=1 Tax=Nocardiopsis alborubida TaxID=146802 RepID=A0A7X6RSP5_9ACTN|nr:hypothetical protein [Nocardiopsis alborubida]NKZ00467.1 hypothetical protein [Nocardiopsis alborubida]